MIFVTLQKNTLISPKFWKEKITPKQAIPVKEFNPTYRFKPLPASFVGEEGSVIKDSVILCVVEGYFIILKETWNTWEFDPNFNKLKAAQSQLQAGMFIQDTQNKETEPEEPDGHDH